MLIRRPRFKLKKPVFLYHLLYKEGLTKVDVAKALPYRVSKLINKNLTIKKTDVILNHKMVLDKNDSLNLAWNRIYDPFETEVMLSLVRPMDVIVDIGAHIGYYTLLFSKITGKGGKVIAFEPGQSSFMILKENVRINNYTDRVVTVNKAVSSEDNREINLYLNNNNPGMNRIFKSEKYGKRTDSIEKIGTISLDSYFNGNASEKIDFVKLDIEGSEYGAIKGMEQTLKNNKNIKIITEFHPVSIREFGVEPTEFLELLDSFGFNIWSLDKITKNKKKIIINDTIQIDELITNSDKYTTNLLCLRQGFS